MSETKAGESVSTESNESVTAGDQELTSTESEIVVDRPPEELARKLKAYANENEKRRHAEKALKKQLEDAQARIKLAEEEKLKEQGQWKGAYENAKRELAEVEEKFKKTNATYAYKTVTAQIKEFALKSGCTETDKMMKLATVDGLLDGLEPDDEYNLPKETLQSIVTNASQKYPEYFGKKAPQLRDGQPTTRPDTKVSLDQVPLKDRTRQLAEMLVKQRQ